MIFLGVLNVIVPFIAVCSASHLRSWLDGENTHALSSVRASRGSIDQRNLNYEPPIVLEGYRKTNENPLLDYRNNIPENYPRPIPENYPRQIPDSYQRQLIRNNDRQILNERQFIRPVNQYDEVILQNQAINPQFIEQKSIENAYLRNNLQNESPIIYKQPVYGLNEPYRANLQNEVPLNVVNNVYRNENPEIPVLRQYNPISPVQQYPVRYQESVPQESIKVEAELEKITSLLESISHLKRNHEVDSHPQPSEVPQEPVVHNGLNTATPKKRYRVIYPNGTVEFLDHVDFILKNNPNSILLNSSSTANLANDGINQFTEPTTTQYPIVRNTVEENIDESIPKVEPNPVNEQPTTETTEKNDIITTTETAYKQELSNGFNAPITETSTTINSNAVTGSNTNVLDVNIPSGVNIPSSQWNVKPIDTKDIEKIKTDDSPTTVYPTSLKTNKPEIGSVINHNQKIPNNYVPTNVKTTDKLYLETTTESFNKNELPNKLNAPINKNTAPIHETKQTSIVVNKTNITTVQNNNNFEAPHTDNSNKGKPTIDDISTTTEKVSSTTPYPITSSTTDSNFDTVVVDEIDYQPVDNIPISLKRTEITEISSAETTQDVTDESDQVTTTVKPRHHHRRRHHKKHRKHRKNTSTSTTLSPLTTDDDKISTEVTDSQCTKVSTSNPEENVTTTETPEDLFIESTTEIRKEESENVDINVDSSSNSDNNNSNNAYESVDKEYTSHHEETEQFDSISDDNDKKENAKVYAINKYEIGDRSNIELPEIGEVLEQKGDNWKKVEFDGQVFDILYSFDVPLLPIEIVDKEGRLHVCLRMIETKSPLAYIICNNR